MDGRTPVGEWAGWHALLLRAAIRYWIGVFPRVRRELRHWQARARRIPDPHLLRIAVETARREGGNYEGAAAFAAFVPRRTRALVVRAVVAYQLAYDYADSLAEEAAADRVANGRALHEALIVAVSPARPHPSYYAHARSAEDGGYLSALVDTCREAVEALPSWSVVDAEARATSRLVVEFQALHHGDEALLERDLSAFASAVPQPGDSLRWWEAAAGGASSLGVFALIAAAARRRLTRSDAEAIQRAYVPWIGALHVLLDSLVDAHHDASSGQHSLVGRYASRAELAARIETIALEALRATRSLPRSREHELLLVAMAGQYLAMPAARLPHAAQSTRRLIAALGEPARTVLLVHRLRGWVATACERN